MNFDIKQLEGETLDNFTVTNLTAGTIILNSRDLEGQIDDLYHQEQLAATRIDNIDAEIVTINALTTLHT